MRRSQLTEFSYFSLYDVVYNGGHFSDNFKNVLLVQSQSLIFGFITHKKLKRGEHGNGGMITHFGGTAEVRFDFCWLKRNNHSDTSGTALVVVICNR